MANSVDLEEVAHYEPPHQDLRCLQIQLFTSLVLKELFKMNPTEKVIPVYSHRCYGQHGNNATNCTDTA